MFLLMIQFDNGRFIFLDFLFYNTVTLELGQEDLCKYTIGAFSNDKQYDWQVDNVD